MVDGRRFRLLVRLACMRDIVYSSSRIALIVGTVLNLINQGEYLFDGKGLMWGHLLLNYAVPYCVATYSAVLTRLRDCSPQSNRA
ncbi:MAG: nitrate/nitrite transporter NrtS [Thiogranum sp.]|nr:nitrate/nitrite transporter NrtS [Thiogranum sp.]